MSTATLILARHGRTAYNQAGLIQGSSPVPLDELGLEQARRLAARIAALEHPPTRIWSSDLLRAEQTAGAVATRLKLDITSDARLREQDFGEYEGRLLSELLAQDAALKLAWTQDIRTLHPPGGESFAEVSARLLDWFHAARPRQPGEVVLAVSHGLALTALLSALHAVRRVGRSGEQAPIIARLRHGNAEYSALELDAETGTVLGWSGVQSSSLDG